MKATRLAGIAAAAAILAAGWLGASPAGAWTLAEAAKPYAGTTIKCVGDGYSPFVAYQKLATEKFTPLTGTKIRIKYNWLTICMMPISTNSRLVCAGSHPN